MFCWHVQLKEIFFFKESEFVKFKTSKKYVHTHLYLKAVYCLRLHMTVYRKIRDSYYEVFRKFRGSCCLSARRGKSYVYVVHE